jgi:hypothetical protein
MEARTMYARARFLVLAVAFGAFAAAVVGTPALQAQGVAKYGVNLVVNGNAEAELGAPDSSTIVKPSGWKTTGQFTAVRYGASGGFPDATSPGPPNRGKSDFEGGNVPKSTASQTISLKAYAAAIDAGSVGWNFSAWLGGFASQGDNAVVSVAFAGADGKAISIVSLGPVTAAERKNVTGLLGVSRIGDVPKGARSAVVSIVLTRLDGEYNDGAADDVSLVLSKKS